MASSTAERYLLLGLRVGRLVDGMVDAYFGPPEFAATVEAEPPPPTARSYVICYPAGRELCTAYVAGDPARFRRLLTEQVRVRDLIEAAEPSRHKMSGTRSTVAE